MISLERTLMSPELSTLYIAGPEHASAKLLFSPDERHLVSHDDTISFVAVWSIEQKRVLGTYGPALAVSMSPASDGFYILTDEGVSFLRFEPDQCKEVRIA